LPLLFLELSLALFLLLLLLLSFQGFLMKESTHT
jgi:hypothetical protein